MVLSINISADANGYDENISPLKRKSELISPSCHRAASSSAAAAASNEVRCPLSEINTISEQDNATAMGTANEVVISTATSYSSTSKPATSKTLSSNTATTKNYSGIKCNKFKSHGTNRPSKYEIEATNEKQASVNQLSEWLANETSKKNKKIQIIDRPPLSASDIHLLRFQNKPRIKKSDVEATDSKRVSVKTISSWMSDDPFEQKKVRTIRTGHKIIAKSRVFEKEEERSKGSRQCDIKVGSVEEKSAWLSGAFKHEGAGEENRTASASFTMEKNYIRPYQTKSVKRDVEAENELKSVKDKKEWLSNAFAKKGGESSTAIHQTKSHEWQHPIHQTRSFEVAHKDTAPNIGKSMSTESSHVPIVYQSKSLDGEDDIDNCLESELKSVRDKKEWLSNAFKKGDEQKAVLIHHANQPEVRHHRHVCATSTLSLRQSKPNESKNDCTMPSIVKSLSADNSHVAPNIYQTKSYDGAVASKPAAAAAATTIAKEWGEVVSLYRKDTAEDKSKPEEALKSVRDKQAWLSNAFKAPASSTPVLKGGVTTQQQQQPKKDLGQVVQKGAVAIEQNAMVNLATKPNTSVERQRNIVNDKPNNDNKQDIDKMSVIDRARWLKMAFK